MERCHKCHRTLLTNIVKVNIVYCNPDKGIYKNINYYHKGCLKNIQKLSLRLSNIFNFDFNNANHVEACVWVYFKTLFIGNSVSPVFDEKTTGMIGIDGIESECRFPVSMELKKKFKLVFY